MSSRSRGETPNTVAFRIETGAKSGPASANEPLLRAHLRLGVRSQRLQRRVLVERVVRPRGAVHRAGRGEDEPPNAGLARRAREPERPVAVDLLGQPRVEIAERVVRERREVDDRVEALRGRPARRRGRRATRRQAVRGSAPKSQPR